MFSNFINNMSQKYRILTVERGDGNTYYVPQVKRGLFKFESIHFKDDPGYSRYESAKDAINTYHIVSVVEYNYPFKS